MFDHDNLAEEDEHEDIADEYGEEEAEHEEAVGPMPLDDECTPAAPASPEMPMPCDFLDGEEIPF